MKSIAITYTPVLNKVSTVLAGLIALSVLLYGIFLLEAVANTAKRTAAEKQVRELTAQTGTLEAQYLSLTQEMTPARAQALGFVTPQKVTTVYAVAPSQTLGYRSSQNTASQTQ